MSAFWVVLCAGLDAAQLDMERGDFLCAVAILASPDPMAAARTGPETLTLDALHRVAWAFRLNLRITIREP